MPTRRRRQGRGTCFEHAWLSTFQRSASKPADEDSISVLTTESSFGGPSPSSRSATSSRHCDQAIHKVCGQFVALCRRLELFADPENHLRENGTGGLVTWLQSGRSLLGNGCLDCMARRPRFTLGSGQSHIQAGFRKTGELEDTGHCPDIRDHQSLENLAVILEHCPILWGRLTGTILSIA